MLFLPISQYFCLINLINFVLFLFIFYSPIVVQNQVYTQNRFFEKNSNAHLRFEISSNDPPPLVPKCIKLLFLKNCKFFWILFFFRFFSIVRFPRMSMFVHNAVRFLPFFLSVFTFFWSFVFVYFSSFYYVFATYRETVFLIDFKKYVIFSFVSYLFYTFLRCYIFFYMYILTEIAKKNLYIMNFVIFFFLFVVSIL